jgi:hypothetical protein
MSDSDNTDIAGQSPPGEGLPPALHAPLLVVSPLWLAQFAPAVEGRDEEHPSPFIPSLHDADGGEFYVAAITLPYRADGERAVRASHLALRLCAIGVRRVIAMLSDGPGVAAVAAVAEAPGALMEDAGSPRACARLAAAIGVAPTSWPATAAGRLDILLALLDAAGIHPDAPARSARLMAYSLGINGSGQVLVPLLATEAELSGRLAGFGAGVDLATLLTLKGVPKLLSTAEIDALPTGRTDILGLFREAALALIRYRTPPSPVSTGDDGA